MIKEAFGTGSTVEEATAQAQANLGAPENADVKIEVIDLGSKKILGLFGGTPAKVRAFFEDSPVDQAVSYLKNILSGMGMTDVKVDAKEEENGDILIDLDCGDDYGIVIGRRGETLDAIQYLTRLVINKGEENYRRVSINVGDYREKREKTLISLAHKHASRVAKYGKSITLEPMNPYERRIIHTAVQDIEGVTSHSVGSDADRRVVITLKDGVKPTNPRKPKNGKGGGYKGKGRGKPRNSGGKSASRPVQNTETRAPRSDSASGSVSLYGKIN